MKTIIAAALVLSAGFAQAQSFDYEQAIGSADLFSTLATEGVVEVRNDSNFDYQKAVGTENLFPTLRTADAESQGNERTVFTYQQNIGSSELDPSLS